jgi:Raf kinase inhibitor-like YbhB/YbcL family protein
MRVNVELENGLLPDRFGKYASDADRTESFPTRSFPIQIQDIPEGTVSIALAFIDFDAIPVGGFCWIHWLACDFAPDTTFIPENASADGSIGCTQGANSNWSPMTHGSKNPAVFNRYCGPQPPDKTHEYTLAVYALDTKLGLPEGYYLNEFRRAIDGHVIEKSIAEIPSRA